MFTDPSVYMMNVLINPLLDLCKGFSEYFQVRLLDHRVYT